MSIIPSNNNLINIGKPITRYFIKQNIEEVKALINNEKIVIAQLSINPILSILQIG